MLIKFVSPEGSETVIEAEIGETVLHCARSNAVPGIVGECGGAMACATCHGYIDDHWVDKLQAPSQDEQAMLAGCVDLRPESRLTCQIVMAPELDGLTIYVPESQT